MVRCPHCANPHSDVKDSRPTTNGSVRRRRCCRACKRRWSTIEISISDYEDAEEHMYFRRNVTKVIDKVEALRDGLNMFLYRVTHTGDDDAQARAGQFDNDSTQGVYGTVKEKGQD